MYSLCYILIMVGFKGFFFRPSQQHQTEGIEYSPGYRVLSIPQVLGTHWVLSTAQATEYSLGIEYPPGTEYCPGY